MRALLILLVPLVYGAVLRPKPELAGVGSSWVINGSPTTISSHAWQLSLRTSAHICGASIVNSRAAVTAAHCVDGSSASSLGVWAGTTDSKNCGSGCSSRGLSSITQHSGYSSGNGFPNDIAVIKWTSAITSGVTYIPLANSGNYDGGWAGNNCEITGWGKTSGSCVINCTPTTLQMASVSIASKSACQGQWGSSIGDYHVCIRGGSVGNYSGACQGDSGGPLACKTTFGARTLVGATSWGTSNCDPSRYTVYASIPYYRTWLNSRI